MSVSQLHRRQFLHMGLNEKNPLLRPPWAIDENDFQSACTRCGDCLQKCPENILIREGVDGYPTVDFTRGDCTFCGDCVEVCATNALDQSRALPWLAKAKVGDACLAAQQVVCNTCAEQCEAGAIRFRAQVGSVAQVVLNLDTCTGCGACVASCPTQAIGVSV